ncbi:MAG: FAD-dependent oxidoreductase [Planctomycetota bacterium]
MDRQFQEQRIRERKEPWDLVVIGGGATGAGIALDAATRNLDVLLLEKSDFGKGTSSRSTKLVHGGVRYLRQGNVSLVRDALKERAILRQNAPHLVHDIAFLIPCRNAWHKIFYGMGLKVYDALAVRRSFGRSRTVSAKRAIELVPTLCPETARGGVVYHDGQFDDSRLIINMLQTAAENDACVLNYVSVEGFLHDEQSRISGVIAVDQESLETLHIAARSVVNAAGPFCDEVRRMDDSKADAMIAPSQGVHLVLPRRFLPGDTAMIVPKTSDGRVIFVVPWHDRAIVGTTDTPIEHATLEPSATDDEIRFLLETASEYLTPAPILEDILSVFTGIRPLVKGNGASKTASLSRDHVIVDSKNGLVTITGGKWTTVRKMAQDCVDHVLERSSSFKAGECQTETLNVRGKKSVDLKDPRSYYGSDLDQIHQLESKDSGLADLLSPALPIRKSDIIWAVRQEMARTLDDVLSRRTRSIILDARAALSIAPDVASLMAQELGYNEDWQRDQLSRFADIAQHFLPPESLH